MREAICVKGKVFQYIAEFKTYEQAQTFILNSLPRVIDFSKHTVQGAHFDDKYQVYVDVSREEADHAVRILC